MQIQQLLDKYEKIVVADASLAKKLMPLQTEKVKVVSTQEGQAAEILDLYRTYEFSDRVIFISNDSNYGTLYNYVRAGIITEREFIEAIQG